MLSRLCYTVGLFTLVAASMLLASEIKRGGFNVTDPNSPQPVFVVVDVPSELPMSGNALGDVAFATTETKHYRWNGVQWVVVMDDGVARDSSHLSWTNLGPTGTAILDAGSTDGSGHIHLLPAAGASDSGTVTLQVAYVGAGAHVPVCVATLTNLTASWNPNDSSVRLHAATSTTQIRLMWHNAAALTPGESYGINYICRRK